MRRMKQLADIRGFPITNFHRTGYGLCSLNGIRIFLKILSFVNFFFKIDDRFFAKIGIFNVALWALKNVLISALNSLLSFFEKILIIFKVRLVFWGSVRKIMISKVIALCLRGNDNEVLFKKTRFFWDTSYMVKRQVLIFMNAWTSEGRRKFSVGLKWML